MTTSTFSQYSSCQHPDSHFLYSHFLPGPMTKEDLEDHINIDGEADVTGTGKKKNEEEEEEEEDIPSDLSILDALKVVRSYAQQNVLKNAILSLTEIEKHLSIAVQSKKSQSSIISFFNNNK